VGDEPETAERFKGKSFEELRRYFHELHAAVTVDAIDEYEAKYRGSEEEVADLVAFYRRYGGEMRNVTECVLFAEETDLCRFKQILDQQIASGVLTPENAYAQFRPPPGPSTSEVVRRAKAKHAARKAKAGGRAGGAAGAPEESDSLFAMIRGRQASRAEAHDAMVDALAAKYAPKPKAMAGKAKATGGSPDAGVTKQSKTKGAHKARKGRAVN
jgi:DnaJ family protein C protein 9